MSRLTRHARFSHKLPFAQSSRCFTPEWIDFDFLDGSRASDPRSLISRSENDYTPPFPGSAWEPATSILVQCSTLPAGLAPVLAIFAADERVGFVVPHDLLGVRIEDQGPAQPRG